MANNVEAQEHLNLILAEIAEIKGIKNFELKPNTNMSYGDGFVAQFFTGEIQNKDTGETISVAIKKAPFWEFDYKSLFVNEYLFYSQAFPSLDRLQKEANVSQPFDNVPIYLSGSTIEAKKEYIAMENLKPLGYVLFDKSKFFDQEHLEFIFRIYGKYHALSSVLQKRNLERYQQITSEMVNLADPFVVHVGKQITSSVNAAVKALDQEKFKDVHNEISDFGENTIATIRKAFEYNGKHRCLLHGDCWSNNMLFKYSDSGELLDVKLLDFQICRDGSPIHDLSYFFYSGASKVDFDNIEYYLQIYYKNFLTFSKELGVSSDEIILFDDLINEWKENALVGVILGIWLWQAKLTSKEDINKLIQDNKGLSEKEIGALWEVQMARAFDSILFKENTTSILIHAVEYGILNKNKIVKNQ